MKRTLLTLLPVLLATPVLLTWNSQPRPLTSVSTVCPLSAPVRLALQESISDRTRGEAEQLRWACANLKVEQRLAWVLDNLVPAGTSISAEAWIRWSQALTSDLSPASAGHHQFQTLLQAALAKWQPAQSWSALEMSVNALPSDLWQALVAQEIQASLTLEKQLGLWELVQNSDEANAAALASLTNGPLAAERLLRQLPQLSIDNQMRLTTAAVESFVATDPVQAAHFAEALAQPEMYNTVAVLWARQDPAAAAAWSLQHAAECPEILAPLISIWGESDPEAASTWLCALPPGPARDAGSVLLISQLLTTEPADAAVWIAQLSDDTTRAGMEAQLLTMLAQTDP